MEKLQLARAVVDIARQAGQAILGIYDNVDEMKVELKADQSPLTIADKISNDIIFSGLSQLEVTHPIVSEETRQLPYEERKAFRTFWLVDPLDGTKEFLKRNGEFTVNIALVEDHRPILGVVYAPVLDELYWGVKGEGAFIETEEGPVRLAAAGFRLSDPGLNVVCSRSHLNDETKAFVDQLNDPELVAKGSSLKFLILAKGDAHVYPRLAPTSEWDTGASQIILEEAGGMIIDQETGLPMRYNKEKLLNNHFIAYGRLDTEVED